jgi:transcription elongation factor Elf1
MKSAVEILCPHCGKETFLKREPVYEGFKKTGEELSCSACGGRFASEAEVPFKAAATAPQIFTDADRSQKVKVFSEGENRNLCRYCVSYVINPFMQFCSLHKKEVQATDHCARFSPAGQKPEKPLF